MPKAKIKSADKDLETIFNKIVIEYIPKSIVVGVISKKLKEKGFRLSKKERGQLEKAVEKSLFADKPFTFKLDRKSRPKKDGELIIDLSGDEVDKKLEAAIYAVSAEIPNLAKKGADAIYKSLKSDSNNQLRWLGGQQKEFNRLINKYWGKPLDSLEILVSICVEIGSNFNEKYRAQAAQSNDVKFEALIRLHAKSCQITNEILHLLRNGFADAAMLAGDPYMS